MWRGLLYHCIIQLTFILKWQSIFIDEAVTPVHVGSKILLDHLLINVKCLLLHILFRIRVNQPWSWIINLKIHIIPSSYRFKWFVILISSWYLITRMLYERIFNILFGEQLLLIQCHNGIIIYFSLGLLFLSILVWGIVIVFVVRCNHECSTHQLITTKIKLCISHQVILVGSLICILLFSFIFIKNNHIGIEFRRTWLLPLKFLFLAFIILILD